MIGGLELDERAGVVVLRGLVAPTGEWRRSGWFQEHLRPGSFRRSLRGVPDVALSLDDEDIPALARGSLDFAEGADGLTVEARLDRSSEGAKRLRDKLRAGRCALAFAFRTPDGGQRWSADLTRRTLTTVDLDGGRLTVRTVTPGEVTPTAALGLEARQAAVERLADGVHGETSLRIAAALEASERTAVDLRLRLADARRRELEARYYELRRRRR
jgi:phage head maturation protease